MKDGGGRGRTRDGSGELAAGFDVEEQRSGKNPGSEPPSGASGRKCILVTPDVGPLSSILES